MISYHATLHSSAGDNVKFDIEKHIYNIILLVARLEHQYVVSIGDYIKASGFIFQNLSNNH